MKKLTFFILLLCSLSVYSQGWKNLQVVCKDSFNIKIPLTVSSLSYDPLNVVSEFSNQLTVAGFKVISEKTAKSSININNTIEKKPGQTEQDISLTRTKEFNTVYAVMVNYTVSTFNYVDIGTITGQVVDLGNDGEIVATFSFRQNSGRSVLKILKTISEKLIAKQKQR